MTTRTTRTYVPSSGGVGPGGVLGSDAPLGTAEFGSASSVVVQEAVGASQDIQVVANYVHLYAYDGHTVDTATGYTQWPLDATGQTGSIYTYERWLRLQFSPTYDVIRRIRFWLPTARRKGWTINFGTTSTYLTPVGTPSTVATSPALEADPFIGNVGPAQLVSDSTTNPQYSDWIVLQAVADLSSVDGGPIGGYTGNGWSGNTPASLTFTVAWGEVWS